MGIPGEGARRRRICIVHTGGTIGMRRMADGYRPVPGYLAERMSAMAELSDPAMPEYRLRESDPLLDSAGMRPGDWVRIARDIAERHERYDGFVVLHGTDTMAYTASALPFLLEGLRKPVIVTGSQIPLCEVRNDARENLITAMLAAARVEIPEVCLLFGSRLLRGCRSTKVAANRFEAFESPNFPSLARIGVGIDVRRHGVRTPPVSPARPEVVWTETPSVAALRIFPGISADLVRSVLRPPVRGLVLETYGMGNAPVNDADFMAALREGTDRGAVIVNCTQCLGGRVRMDAYATGSGLARAGVTSGHDMTAEAALAKMICLFGRGWSAEAVRNGMGENLAGELTPPENKKRDW
jgi:L-asparaginase